MKSIFKYLKQYCCSHYFIVLETNDYYEIQQCNRCNKSKHITHVAYTNY